MSMLIAYLLLSVICASILWIWCSSGYICADILRASLVKHTVVPVPQWVLILFWPCTLLVVCGITAHRWLPSCEQRLHCMVLSAQVTLSLWADVAGRRASIGFVGVMLGVPLTITLALFTPPFAEYLILLSLLCVDVSIIILIHESR